MMMTVGAIVLIAVNVIVLSVNSRNRTSSTPIGQIVISVISPVQEVVTESLGYFKGIWRHYFDLVNVSKENDQLQKRLEETAAKNNALKEMELSNERMRELLGFQASLQRQVAAAEVVGRDPSAWFKTVIINKGKKNGVAKGMPVVTPAGVVGLIMEASGHFSKVLLVIDQNSAVDALVQSTRARGIIKGEPSGGLTFEYSLRRLDINKGDTVISSGLDNVYPKGLRIGYVQQVKKPDAGIFQEVFVTPYVNFEKLEEVLVILDYSKPEDVAAP